MKDRKKQKRLTRSEFCEPFYHDIGPASNHAKHSAHRLCRFPSFAVRKTRACHCRCTADFHRSSMEMREELICQFEFEHFPVFFFGALRVCMVLAPVNVTINKSLNLPSNRFNQFRTNRFVSYFSLCLPFHSTNIATSIGDMSRYGMHSTSIVPLKFFISFALRFLRFSVGVFRIVSFQEYRLFPELHASSCLCCHQWIVVLFSIRKLSISCVHVRQCVFSMFWVLFSGDS